MTDRRNDTVLLATDLDRTLLPNGDQPESPTARACFRRLVARPEVTLVYVTGRHRMLVERAMAEYGLPQPEFVIGDVGASLYAVQDHDWQPMGDWQQAIAPDWAGCGHDQLAGALAGVSGLRLQEPGKQAPFKLSYYAAALDDPSALLAEVRDRLAATGARSNLIWSIDETTATGLLDVLPARASKLHALEFLREQLGIPLDRTVFAGDSGNDLEVLESAVPAVLVANAQPSVRAAALARAAKAGNSAALYLARGDWPGLNGNYSVGILEGVAYFIPATRHWLEL
jgi:HAD superfamily hydrolase (TIGR01484 family)